MLSPRPQWQDEVGRKKEDSMEKSKSQVEDTEGEKIRRMREVIHGQKSWQDLQTRRVRTLVGCKAKDKTDLSYHPGVASLLGAWPLA